MSTLRDILLFVVFDQATKLPKFTKYNFNFIKYAQKKGITESSKLDLFKSFLQESNNTDYSKVFNVNGFEEYFIFDNLGNINQNIVDYINKYGTTIHDNYITTKDLDTYIDDYDKLINDQFDLIPYDDSQIRFIQDYFYTMDADKNMFTKYNFDFDLYSADFKIWGSKLNIFTDFVVRCYTLSGAITRTFGYGLPDNFKKYFINQNNLVNYLKNNNIDTDLITYMSKYAITSNLTSVVKNTNNIIYTTYVSPIFPTLSFPDMDYFKNYFYSTGQFELATFKLNRLDQPKNVFTYICTVFSLSGNGFGTGFLFNINGDPNIYIMTCYHVISGNSNYDIIRVSLNNSDDTNLIAEFSVVGYNSFIDVAVAKFDPNLQYNIINGINMDTVKNFDKIYFNGDKKNINKRDLLYYIGNLSSDSDNAILEGTVIDNNFSGEFDDDFFIAGPNSILINTTTTAGFSGSPVFYKNSSTNELIIAGMYNAQHHVGTTTYAHIIQSSYLYTAAINMIGNRNLFNSLYPNNKVFISYITKISIPFSWLGTFMCYFNPNISSQKYKSLVNFNYNGGILIEKFIYGFDLVNNMFITEPQKIGMFNTINLETPLLNTLIYKRYIESSMSPIVIKSITFYNSLTNEYDEYLFGKYGNQKSFNAFTDGFKPISQVVFDKTKFPDKKFISGVYSTYAELKINYFYYNGSVWVNENCIVGGSDDSWHTLTTDNYGYSWFQSKFAFPYVLYPYLSPYYIGSSIPGSEDAEGSSFTAVGSSFTAVGVSRAVAKRAAAPGATPNKDNLKGVAAGLAERVRGEELTGTKPGKTYRDPKNR